MKQHHHGQGWNLHRIFQQNMDINGHDRQAVLPHARVCLSMFWHDSSMAISIQAILLMAVRVPLFSLIKDHSSGPCLCSHPAEKHFQLRSRVALKMWTSSCSGCLVCVVILAAAVLVSPSGGTCTIICRILESFPLKCLTLGRDKGSHLTLKHIEIQKYCEEPTCPAF